MKTLNFGSIEYSKKFSWFCKKCGYKSGQEMEAGFFFLFFQKQNISLKPWLADKHPFL